MTTFKDDYEMRLRRLCGVTDDSVRVEVDCDREYVGFGHQEETVNTLTVQAYPDGRYLTVEFRGVWAHEDLMNTLFKVEL